MKRISLVALLASTCLGTATQALTLTSDIAYGDGTRQQMDIYMPAGVDAPPVVLFVHGGRWFRNDKTQITLYDRHTKLTDAGYAVASMNFAYSSEALWPQQLDDVTLALAYLRENAAALGIDAGDIAIWGQSSGAHMALMGGMTAEPAVDAIVSWYAPSDLKNIAPDRLADDVKGGNERFPEPSPETLLLGVSVSENSEAADGASPTHLVETLEEGAVLPPMLLMHGTADFVISPLQSQRLYEALAASGAVENLTLSYVEGGKHGGDLFAPKVDEVIDFLDGVFGR